MTKPTEINGLPGLWLEDEALAATWAAGPMIHCPQCGNKAAGLPWGGSMQCDSKDCGVGIGWGGPDPRWFRSAGPVALDLDAEALTVDYSLPWPSFAIRGRYEPGAAT